MTAGVAPVEATSATSAIVDPRARRLQRLATVLASVAILVALGVAAFAAFGDPRFTLPLNLVTVGFFGIVGLFSVMGALIIQRRPSTKVAWLMIGIGLGIGVGLLCFAYGVNGAPPAPPLPLALELLLISQLFFTPAIGLGTIFILLLFPTDRLVTPRWRLVGYVGLAGVVLGNVSALFNPGAIDAETVPGVVNPLAAPAELTGVVELGLAIGNLLVTVALLLASASLVVRYRRAGSVEAAQIRWLALVAILAALFFAITTAVTGPVSDLAFGLGLLSLAGMPVATGIAITRYRLYEIDRLINRALVYGSLTAILAGTFTAAVGLAQRIFVAATGETSDAALIGATLVIATLYAPLRKRLEAVVNRRFKFEDARFGGYRDELTKHLALTDPARACRRLAEEAVRELDAVGGAILDRAGAVVASSGTWPSEPAVRLEIPDGRAKGQGGAVLVVGARRTGREHDPQRIEALREVVALAGAAMAQVDAPRR